MLSSTLPEAKDTLSSFIAMPSLLAKAYAPIVLTEAGMFIDLQERLP